MNNAIDPMMPDVDGRETREFGKGGGVPFLPYGVAAKYLCKLVNFYFYEGHNCGKVYRATLLIKESSNPEVPAGTRRELTFDVFINQFAQDDKGKTKHRSANKRLRDLICAVTQNDTASDYNCGSDLVELRNLGEGAAEADLPDFTLETAPVTTGRGANITTYLFGIVE